MCHTKVENTKLEFDQAIEISLRFARNLWSPRIKLARQFGQWYNRYAWHIYPVETLQKVPKVEKCVTQKSQMCHSFATGIRTCNPNIITFCKLSLVPTVKKRLKTSHNVQTSMVDIVLPSKDIRTLNNINNVSHESRKYETGI